MRFSLCWRSCSYTIIHKKKVSWYNKNNTKKMRFGLVVFLIAALIIANIYTEGRLLKHALTWKKYYQMAGVALIALAVYWLFTKNPEHARGIIYSSNEYLKYLPVDKDTKNMLGPILDFTKKQDYNPANSMNDGYDYPVVNMNSNRVKMSQRPCAAGGGTKRSVSESRKKMIAASQGWKCSHCKSQLDYNYQIDHIIRLEYGGSNEPSNLTALCPNCHTKKTIQENLVNSPSKI